MPLDVQTPGHGFDGLIHRQSESQQADADVFADREKRKKTTGLQDVPDVRHADTGQPAQFLALPGIHDILLLPILTEKGKLAGFVGLQHHGQEIQQGALAASAQSHQGHLFPPMNKELRYLQGKTLGTRPSFGYIGQTENLRPLGGIGYGCYGFTFLFCYRIA